MADELVNMADQFKGLPLSDLIGTPLEAACTANTKLAKATADFINTVGFEPGDPKVQGSVGKPRMVDFNYERPALDKDGKRTVEVVNIRVPMLAIVPIPNLQVDLVDITFDMEVKSSTSSKSSEDKSGSFNAHLKVGWGPVSASVSMAGSVATHKENTRTSDNSAKYHVQVKATNHGIPEGLARVLDIMADAAKPRSVVSHEPDENGNIKPDSKGTPVDPVPQQAA